MERGCPPCVCGVQLGGEGSSPNWRVPTDERDRGLMTAPQHRVTDGREGRVSLLTAAKAGAGDALVLQALGGEAAQRAGLQAPAPEHLSPSWSQHSHSTLPWATCASQDDTVTHSAQRQDAGAGVRTRQECSLQHTDNQCVGLQSGLLHVPALHPSSQQGTFTSSWAGCGHTCGMYNRWLMLLVLFSKDMHFHVTKPHH